MCPGQWEKLPLRTLERELVVQDIAEKESIKVLEKATVPIVKMTDKYSDVKVTIIRYHHHWSFAFYPDITDRHRLIDRLSCLSLTCTT